LVVRGAAGSRDSLPEIVVDHQRRASAAVGGGGVGEEETGERAAGSRAADGPGDEGDLAGRTTSAPPPPLAQSETEKPTHSEARTATGRETFRDAESPSNEYDYVLHKLHHVVGQRRTALPGAAAATPVSCAALGINR